MIAVLLLFMAVATLLCALPYWFGRSHVRYRVWRERDALFDGLVERGWDDDVLWGLVDRCDILLRGSTLLTPMSLALTRTHPDIDPPTSRAFPDDQAVALLTDAKQAFYMEAGTRIDGLLMRQLLLTSWHGLALGALAFVVVFFRSGAARSAVGAEVRRRLNGEPERAMAAGAFC